MENQGQPESGFTAQTSGQAGASPAQPTASASGAASGPQSVAASSAVPRPQGSMASGAASSSQGAAAYAPAMPSAYAVPITPVKEPFYRRTWFLVLLTIVCPVAGIPLMWVFGRPKSTPARIALTVVAALVILASLGSLGSQSGSGTYSQSDTPQASATEGGSGSGNAAAPAASAPAPTLTAIEAKYTGSTEAGTMIKQGTSGLVVTGTYSDNTTKTVSDYVVDNPAALVAGETSTFTITVGDKSCPLEIACTTLTPEQFKDSCEWVEYEDLARNESDWLGKNVAVTGKVIQVQEDKKGNAAYRVSITKGSYDLWDDPVYVVAGPSASETRILEEDIVTVYGISSGLYTYTTVLGASMTVPSIAASYIDLA